MGEIDKDELSAHTKSRNVLRRILGLLSNSDKIRLLVGSVAMVATSASNIMTPLMLGKVIKVFRENGNTRAVLKESLAVFAIGALGSFIRTHQMGIVGYNMKAKLRMLLHSAIIRSKLAFHHSNPASIRVNMIFNDANEACDAILRNATNFFRFSNSVFGMSFMLYRISPKLTRFTFGMVPFVGLSIGIFSRIKKIAIKRLETITETAVKRADERLQNVKTVKLFSKEEDEIIEFNKLIKDSSTFAHRAAFADGLLFGSIGLTINTSVLALLSYASKLNISPDQFTSFLMYAGFIGAGFSGFGQLYVAHKKTVENCKKLYSVIDDASLNPDTTQQPAIVNQSVIDIINKNSGACVEFKSVSHSYDPSKPLALKAVTFKVEAGEHVCIAGSSGSGKSTIIGLINGLVAPNPSTDSEAPKASFTVGGLDLSILTEPERAFYNGKIVAVVEQESELFDLSIEENIRYGRPEATLEDVKEAATAADIHSFIETLPYGYGSKAGFLGCELSQGQKQRLAIARAILCKPSVLLMDESTSALDGATEQRVLNGIRKYIGKNTTIIAVAHRETVMQHADRVMVMSHGELVASGSYKELMDEKQNGALWHVLKDCN